MTARAVQEQRMRTVCAQLALTSNGTTRSYDSSGGGEGLRLPRSGDANPPHVIFWRRFESATTELAREAVIQAAEDELARIRGRIDRSNVTGETAEQRNVRIVREGEGFPAKVVAISFRCSARDVWKAREQAGRDAETGRASSEDKRERAVSMSKAGASVRDIAQTLDIPKSSVSRWLRNVA